MYKGTLTIELTNEKTGEKEIHKDENMVTNAVAYVLGIAAQEASSPNNATNDFPYLLPVGKRALGGIFLFDGPLEENADKDKDGKLIINEEQAKVVRRIYQLFEEGHHFGQIGNILKSEGQVGMKANTWPAATIEGILQNEKYCGDSLMQKSYTPDFLTKKRVKNNGEVDQYFIAASHEAIIPKEEWEAVQEEIKRREEYRKKLGIHSYRYGDFPFSGHVVCAHCGQVFQKFNSKEALQASLWVRNT